MRRFAISLVWLILLTTLSASITVLESSENQITLEYRLDKWSLTEQDGMIRIDAANMDYAIRSGAPLLPNEETKVGIPPQGSVYVSVMSSSSHSEKLKYRLAPVPKVVMKSDMSDYIYAIDEELYSAKPAPFLNNLEPQSYRGYGFVPMQINPFAYDGGYELTITDQAVIRIDINGNTGYRSSDPGDDLSELLLKKLANPVQTSNWQSAQRYDINYADFAKSDFWLRLETNQDGMYKITPAQMSGFPIQDIDPRSFRLFSTGGSVLPFTVVSPGAIFHEIPIQVIGEADGNLDSSDYIVFYGISRDGVSKNTNLQPGSTYYNPYSANTVYWLTFGGQFSGDPLRIQTQATLTSWVAETSYSTDQTRLETESQRREVIGFDWFMTRMFGSTTAEYQFEMDLSGVVDTIPKALDFVIQQEDVDTNVWHYITVYVNDIAVPADNEGSLIFQWRGTGEYHFHKEVSGILSGTNLIRIKVIRSSTDNLFLNWITLDHTRINQKDTGQSYINQLALNYNVPVRYNIIGSGSFDIYRINSFFEVEHIPLQTSASELYFVTEGIAGSKFWLNTESELYTPLNFDNIDPVDLTDTSSQVDNAIIAADEYYAQAQSLANMYEQDLGKTSLVVKQSDVFNQFNGGHPDPAALRQFLRYVWQNFPAPHLTSVTLLGLGTLDWRNFSGQSAAKNKIMVYQHSYLTSDDYFVMLTQSAYPELAIGRYPVSNATELSNMLTNFQNYVQNQQGGWWRDSMVFLGDDLFNGSQTSYENIHTRQTQDAADVVNPSVLIDKIFAWEYEYDEFQNKPGARDDMISDINDGRLLWYYVGHGSYDKLGAEDYFNGASDMGRFNNPDKLPFFMAASCKVSHFDYWGFESLGQKTVLLNNRGAIASYSATRISAPYNNAPMMQFLLESLANDRNSVGYAIMDAKTRYTQSNDNDAVYVLLGDPLLMIIPPQRDTSMTITGNSTKAKDETLNAREQASITGGFSPSSYSGVAEIKVFNTEPEYDLDWQTHVSHRGAPLYKGSATVSNGAYNAGFIVPDDVITGDTGLVVSYLWDPNLKEDYVNYQHPLSLNDQAVIADNPDTPAIEIFLGSMDFRPGDTVGTDPTLYAKISDTNGINVTGSSGHHILLVLDNSLQPIPVTDYFSYDLDSHSAGTLTYPFSDLAEGSHTLQVIAFDNFNMPSVATTTFLVKKIGELSIERFLIYPNPMKSNTNFTFMLSEDCDLTIDIFTLTGKKIHSIKAIGKQGFNSIPWNGKDDAGDRFANNTYFVKVRASGNGLKAEKTEKLVIYN